MIDPRLEGKPVPRYSVADMERDNVARIDAMKGSDLAFLDQRMPGHEREIINVIGMGVTENMAESALAPKIAAPCHGFAITYVRAGDTKGAALHRHPTEEVFVPIKSPDRLFRGAVRPITAGRTPRLAPARRRVHRSRSRRRWQPAKARRRRRMI